MLSIMPKSLEISVGGQTKRSVSVVPTEIFGTTSKGVPNYLGRSRGGAPSYFGQK